MVFGKYLTEGRRLVILRLLSQAPEYELSDAMIQELLDRFGHNVSRDRVRTDLAWLAEQGLVTTIDVAEHVVTATVTRLGFDCAAGRHVVPGVKRPGPLG